MTSFSKAEKKEIRRLAEFAYQRELAAALNSLYQQFERWRKNKITPFDLTGDIHKFHNGIARDLWNLYDGRDNHIAVARAIAKGIIPKEDANSAVLSKLEDCIRSFNSKD